MQPIKEKLIKQLDAIFKGRAILPSECISLNNDQLVFIDDSQDKAHKYCIFVLPADAIPETMVEVRDSNSTEKALMAYDGKFIGEGKGGSKCDAILFNESVLCFIEMKMNASSANPSYVASNREKGLKQLETIISEIIYKFKHNQFGFDEYELRAYLCTPSFYPERSTSIASEVVRFWDDYKVNLDESNVIAL